MITVYLFIYLFGFYELPSDHVKLKKRGICCSNNFAILENQHAFETQKKRHRREKSFFFLMLHFFYKNLIHDFWVICIKFLSETIKIAGSLRTSTKVVTSATINFTSTSNWSVFINVFRVFLLCSTIFVAPPSHRPHTHIHECQFDSDHLFIRVLNEGKLREIGSRAGEKILDLSPSKMCPQNRHPIAELRGAIIIGNLLRSSLYPSHQNSIAMYVSLSYNKYIIRPSWFPPNCRIKLNCQIIESRGKVRFGTANTFEGKDGSRHARGSKFAFCNPWFLSVPAITFFIVTTGQTSNYFHLVMKEKSEQNIPKFVSNNLLTQSWAQKNDQPQHVGPKEVKNIYKQ